ncbi:unnamed protein product [Paramecium octaurelia]|uniref:Tetratricopeptide repeat protein n=1 Tax=Paramecium octaurelia TaxID=43137 RepID=A0A8S1STW0_PAROT|nr:unnamed protein product [Paramecium octaurelia]
MLSSEGVKWTCKIHNKPVVQVCIQKCNNDQKASCLTCTNSDLQHFRCQYVSLEDIPKQVESHQKLFQEIQNSIIQLEDEFKNRIQIMKEVLDGYQIQETFRCIIELEHVNLLANVLRKLPKIKERVNEISNIIKDILQSLSSQKLEPLKKWKQECLETTMQQSEQTTRLIQNLRNQNNQGNMETINRLDTNQNTNRSHSIQELLNQGKVNLGFLKCELAITCFDQVLKVEPNNIEAKVGLMNTLCEMDYLNSSFSISQKILEQDPQNFEAALQQGVILYNQKKYGESISHITQKLNRFSNHNKYKEVLKLLYNNYIENNQLQHAKTELDKLRLTYGDNLSYNQGMAKCCIIENQLNEAQYYLNQANQIRKDDLENDLIQLQIFEKQCQYSKCLDQIRQKLRGFNKIKDQRKLIKLQIFQFYEVQNFQEAIFWCQLYQENYQDDIDIQYIFGKCLLENKQYSMAIHFFDKVLRQSQHHCKAQNAKNQAQEKKNLLNQSSVQSVRNRQSSVIQSHDFQSSCRQNFQQDYLNLLLHKAGTILVDNLYPCTVIFLDECINNFPFDEELKVLKAKYYLKTTVAIHKQLAFELLDSIVKKNPHNLEAQHLLKSINFLSIIRNQNYQ